jgi:hypothetical protein
MHAVVRTYSGKGAKELMDVLEKSKADVERLIRSVDGFVSFSLVRTATAAFQFRFFGISKELTKAFASHGNGSQRTLATSEADNDTNGWCRRWPPTIVPTHEDVDRS